MKTFDEIKNLLVAIQNGYEPTDEEILEIKQVWSDVLDALKPIAEFLEKNAVEGVLNQEKETK